MSTSSGNLVGHLLRGQRTRERVLLRAVPIATEEGLDALTIGRVAEVVGITKAGLLGHYGSKEALQIATLDAGRDAFVDFVVKPALTVPTGIARVVALLDGWVDYVVGSPGGCFFASVAAEFDGRKGPVRDHIAKMVTDWLSLLDLHLQEAVQHKHLATDANLADLSYQLHAYQLSLNLRYQLLDEKNVVGRTRRAMRSALATCATASGRRILSTTASPRKRRNLTR